MNRALWVARREWLEQGRQPAMIGVIAATWAVIAGLVVASVFVLDLGLAAAGRGELDALVGLPGPPEPLLRGMAATAVAAGQFLMTTQLLGLVGVLAGHALLHDRQLGTLPFLLLAPLRRGELLVGKVLGALALPLLGHQLAAWACFSLVSRWDVASELGHRLPGSTVFAVVTSVGTPAWAAALAAACALVSASARDVRTAQQSVWFILLFATLGVGGLLVGLMDQGAGVQLGVAAVGAGSAAGLLAAGGQLLSRDLGRG